MYVYYLKNRQVMDDALATCCRTMDLHGYPFTSHPLAVYTAEKPGQIAAWSSEPIYFVVEEVGNGTEVVVAS